MVYLKNATKVAIEENVTKKTKIIGIGSGRSIPFIVYFLKKITKKIGTFKNIVCVPSSFITAQILRKNNFIVNSFEQLSKLDVYFDGVDVINQNLTAIKGCGYAMLKEKILAKASTNGIVFICDESKFDIKEKGFLGHAKKSIKIEILPNCSFFILKEIKENLFPFIYKEKSICSFCILEIKKSTDINSSPLVTENGFFVIEWNPFVCSKHNMFFKKQYFSKGERFWSFIENELKKITGVIECGLFTNIKGKCYIEKKNGSILTLKN